MPKREFTPSSGNVFAGLNLPHADDLLAKAELAAKIIAEIQRRRLTQSQAAAILAIDQPKVSALKQGKLSGFSIERLMRLLLRPWGPCAGRLESRNHEHFAVGTGFQLAVSLHDLAESEAAGDITDDSGPF